MKRETSVEMHKLLDKITSSSNSIKHLYKWTTDATGTITHLINSNVDDEVCNNLLKYYNTKLKIIDKFIKEIE